MECFECGKEAEHNHHVVPQSLGGTRTVPLCRACHGLIHGVTLAHAALTRAGLERARARGVKLGGQRPECRSLTPEARARGSAATRAQFVLAYAHLVPRVKSMRAQGQTLAAIAAALNAEGHRTRQGAYLSHVHVARLLKLEFSSEN